MILPMAHGGPETIVYSGIVEAAAATGLVTAISLYCATLVLISLLGLGTGFFAAPFLQRRGLVTLVLAFNLLGFSILWRFAQMIMSVWGLPKMVMLAPLIASGTFMIVTGVLSGLWLASFKRFQPKNAAV